MTDNYDGFWKTAAISSKMWTAIVNVEQITIPTGVHVAYMCLQLFRFGRHNPKQKCDINELDVIIENERKVRIIIFINLLVSKWVLVNAYTSCATTYRLKVYFSQLFWHTRLYILPETFLELLVFSGVESLMDASFSLSISPPGGYYTLQRMASRVVRISF